MPTWTFAVDDSGAKPLEISTRDRREYKVSLDGRELGTVESRTLRDSGKTYQTSRGSLRLKRTRMMLQGERWDIRLDGALIPDSETHPQKILETAAAVIWVIAVISTVVGVLGLLQVEFILQAFGDPLIILVSAAVYGLLGYFARRRSMIALGLAVGLFALDSILGLYFAAEGGGSISPGNFVVRLLMLLLMLPGFRAIQDLKRMDTAD